jgi:hypothetical protein
MAAITGTLAASKESNLMLAEFQACPRERTAPKEHN